ncbi:MAG: prepilin peptidase [Candidatus Hodarchaeales archaeon]
MVDTLLIIFSSVMLSVGSFYDLRDREISDILWIIMSLGGILLHFTQILIFLSNNDPFIEYLSQWFSEIIFGVIISLILFFLGLWGGADLLALISISICLPASSPMIIVESQRIKLLLNIFPQSLTVLMNAIILTMPVPLIIFLYNLINRQKHPEKYKLDSEPLKNILLAYFIGYPCYLSQIEKNFEKKIWHYDFLENYTPESQWKLCFQLGLDTPENDYARKKDIFDLAKSQDKSTIWIQPSYPFILILLIGYVVSIFVGNLLFLLFDFLI